MFQDALETLSWRSLADVVLVALLFYQIISMLKGTRAAQVVVGLLVIFFAYVISSVLQLETLNWIISKFYSSFILVVIVLFQDDIRRLLTRFGRGPFVSGIDESQGAAVIDQVVAAVASLSHDRIGALVVFERGVGLDKLYDRSVALDAMVTEHLLMSIFHTFSPLHDGAVIIQKNRVACASAHLPLSKSSSLSRKLGTRHSAALGISEETDAVVLVVSEETGAISIAHNGRLELQNSPAQTRDSLMHLLMPLGDRAERIRQRRAAGQASEPVAAGFDYGPGTAGLSYADGVALATGSGLSGESALREGADEASMVGAGHHTAEGGAGSGLAAYNVAGPEGSLLAPEGPSEAVILQDVRRLSKLHSTERFKPPVMPTKPPRDVSIGGAPLDAPVEALGGASQQTASGTRSDPSAGDREGGAS